MANGCPQKILGDGLDRKFSNSKHQTRCCKNDESLYIKPMNTAKSTYKEAEEICDKNGARLCFASEVEKCCQDARFSSSVGDKWWINDNIAGNKKNNCSRDAF